MSYTISFLILFSISHSKAATIKQLLNDQHLAVLELSKSEEVVAGDGFIASDSRNQCLIEVLHVDGRLATVSTRQCTDKAILTINKKVEKSLISPKIIAHSQATSPLQLEKELEKKQEPIQPEQKAPEAKTTSNKLRAFHDLNYWPLAGEFAGSTSFSSNQTTISENATGDSADSDLSLLTQSIGLGITDNFAANLILNNVTGGDGEAGLQSPVFQLDLHTDSYGNDTIFGIGFIFSPKGKDDDSLRSNYQGFAISFGESTIESSFRASLIHANYAESDTTKAQTLTGFQGNYQPYIKPTTFLNLGFSILNYSDEEYIGSTIKFKYATIPKLNIGLGGASLNKQFSWRITYEKMFATKVILDTTVDRTLEYSGNSMTLSLGYMF